MIDSSQGGAEAVFNYIEYCALSKLRGVVEHPLWIRHCMEQFTFEYFEQTLSSNATSNLEHTIFDRKWAWSVKTGVAFKNFAHASRSHIV